MSEPNLIRVCLQTIVAVMIGGVAAKAIAAVIIYVRLRKEEEPRE